MSRPDITSLLDARIGAWADKNGIAVAYDNVQFEPPSGIYLTCHDMPATPYAIDISQRAKVFIGVYQINVVIPTGDGRTEGRELASQIEDLFQNGLEIAGNGFSCYIVNEPAQYAGITTDTTYTIPVSMNYRADISC